MGKFISISPAIVFFNLAIGFHSQFGFAQEQQNQLEQNQLQQNQLQQNQQQQKSPFAEKPLTNEDLLKDAEDRIQRTQSLAHILRRKSAGNQIAGLELLSEKAVVLYNLHEGLFKPTVEVQLAFHRPGWKAYLGEKGPELPYIDGYQASVFLYLKGQISELLIVARNDAGEVEKEKIFIYAPQVRELSFNSPWNKLMLSLGGGLLDYQQTAVGRFRSGNAAGAVLYSPERLWDRMSLILRGDLTFGTFYSSPVRAGPQAIDARADLTYDIEWGYDPSIQWEVLGGISFQSLLASGSSYGFSALIAPEFGLRSRYNLNPTHFLVGEFRFSPLSGADFGQKGLQFGLTWSRWMENLRRTDLSLEYFRTTYTPQKDIFIDFNLIILKMGISI